MTTRSTTIIAVMRNGKAAMAGDGQVTLDETIMKSKAVKIRTMHEGKILTGFAGAAADGLALYELLEKRIDEYSGNLPRAAVELAKEWRTDKSLQKLEAVIAVTDNKHIFLISGTGDIIEPDDGIIVTGSGGPFALAAARGLIAANAKMPVERIVETAMNIAADICIYTNHHIKVESLS